MSWIRYFSESIQSVLCLLHIYTNDNEYPSRQGLHERQALNPSSHVHVSHSSQDGLWGLLVYLDV